MKKFTEWLEERDAELLDEYKKLSGLRKLGALGLGALGALGMTGQAQGGESPFVAEKPAISQQTDWAKMLQPFAGQDVEDVMSRHTQENPTLSPEAWKVGAKLYKGTNSVGMVPNPDKTGQWVAPGGGSIRVKSTSEIGNNKVQRYNQELTPYDAAGKQSGKTIYDYSGEKEKGKVSGGTIRQVFPSSDDYRNYGPGKVSVRSLR